MCPGPPPPGVGLGGVGRLVRWVASMSQEKRDGEIFFAISPTFFVSVFGGYSDMASRCRPL